MSEDYHKHHQLPRITGPQQQHQQHGIVCSPSRPMSPGEQFQLINTHQKWEDSIGKTRGEPNKTDAEVRERGLAVTLALCQYWNLSFINKLVIAFTFLLFRLNSHITRNFIFAVSFHIMQRYMHYLVHGVSLKDLPPMPADIRENVNTRLHPKFLKNPHWKELRRKLWEETEDDYKFSWQKSVVDYILMDSSEMERLKIGTLPQQLPRKVVRAPVPWHNSFLESRDAQMLQLFITNEIMRDLQILWENK